MTQKLLVVILVSSVALASVAFADETGAPPQQQAPAYNPPPPPDQPPPPPNQPPPPTQPPGYPQQPYQQPYQQPPYQQPPYQQPYAPELGPNGKPLISNGQYVTGGWVGTLAGFGIGHAIQGRYSPNGLIFTIGDAVGYGIFIGALASCSTQNYNSYGVPYNTYNNCNTGLEWAGLGVLLGFHIWEIIDVWNYPHQRPYPRPRRYSFWAAPVNSVAQNSYHTAMEAGVGIHF